MPLMRSESKRLAFEALLDRGKVRLLFLLDVEGVVVPDVARGKSPNGRALALDYSKRFTMPHFEVSDEGVRAVLTFGGRSHMTFVPWDAVVGVVQDGQLMEAWAPPAPSAAAGREAEGPKATPDLEFEIDEDEVKWLCQTVGEG